MSKKLHVYRFRDSVAITTPDRTLYLSADEAKLFALAVTAVSEEISAGVAFAASSIATRDFDIERVGS